MYVYVTRYVKRCAVFLCFTYDTCLHTSLFLNKSVETIKIVAYIIAYDKYITKSDSIAQYNQGKLKTLYLQGLQGKPTSRLKSIFYV